MQKKGYGLLILFGLIIFAALAGAYVFVVRPNVLSDRRPYSSFPAESIIYESVCSDGTRSESVVVVSNGDVYYAEDPYADGEYADEDIDEVTVKAGDEFFVYQKTLSKKDTAFVADAAARLDSIDDLAKIRVMVLSSKYGRPKYFFSRRLPRE